MAAATAATEMAARRTAKVWRMRTTIKKKGRAYQLAPLVGYQDPRYFAQVFKKLTGRTPSEYRESFTRPAEAEQTRQAADFR
ncbi:AraC family transcriptional regulator [Paenibacillus tarimensis]